MILSSVRRLMVVGALAVIAPLVVLVQPASAAEAIPPQPQFKVTVTRTQADKVDFRTDRRVGRCTVQESGTTCTLSVTKTVGTTISVQGGVSVAFVSGQIGFSRTATSAAGVSCTSPKLKRGDTFSAFAIGTGKYYTISKRVSGSWQQVGGINYAWQPHTFPDIWCGQY